MSENVRYERNERGYVRHTKSAFGSSQQQLSVAEYRKEIALTWFFRAVNILIVLGFIMAIVAYFGYCLPYWFQSILNVPVICLARR